MRKIIIEQPCFFLNLTCDQKIIEEYRSKYNAIGTLLDENDKILNAVHNDLRYYGSDKGKGSTFSSEQILRMIMVLFIEQLPYRNTIIRVSESDFLRNFTRIGMGKVMSFGFLCGAFKSIKIKTWKYINSILNAKAQADEKISGDTLRIDSTVCESNIHFPTDAFLLWDSYRVLARLMRQCTEAEPLWNLGNRFHEKKIKKLYTYVSTHSNKKNKRTKRKVQRTLKTLINRVSILCEKVERYLQQSSSIPTINPVAFALQEELSHFHHLGVRVVLQSHRLHILKENVPASERIFSIFEEHTELLKRGKAGKPNEFGHMVTLAQTKEKFISFYDIRERSLHDIEMKKIALESHKKAFSCYPKRFVADKNYYESMADITSWEEDMELCAIAKKGGKNTSEYNREQSDEFKAMQRFRAGIEGTISVLKRAFGLKRCAFKGFKSFAAAIGCLVFCHNAVLLSRL